MNLIRSLVFASMLASTGGVAQATGLIKNGGFERPAPPPGGFHNYNPGQRIGPWTVVGNGNVATVSTTYRTRGYVLNARRGLSFLDLTGLCDCGASSGVSQSVATTPDASYTLSFWVGNAVIPGAGKKCTVNVYNGTTLLVSAANGHGKHHTHQVWRKFSVTFTATDTTTTLSFINSDKRGDINCGLDVVDMVAN